MTQNTELHDVTWVIGSTGVNNYGTRVSTTIGEYLKGQGFTKSFSGNPTYSTTKPYTDEEMNDIAKHIQKIRNDANPEQQDKTQVKYWRVEKEFSL